MDAQLQKSTELLELLGTLTPLAGSRWGEELTEEIAFLERLFRAKILFEARAAYGRPLVVAVAGGTNVGKSETFNALAGRAVSLPDPRAGRTRRPAVFARADHEDMLKDPEFLRGLDRSPLKDPEDLNRSCADNPCFHMVLGDEAGLPVLIDSPDIDSNRLENLESARRLLAAADVIVFVTSPSKYNDEACVAFLDLTRALGREVDVVFNFLGPEAEKVVKDFHGSVLEGREVPGGVTVVEVPRFAADLTVFEEMTRALAPLREKIAGFDVPAVKLAQARGTWEYVRSGCLGVCSKVEQDVAEVEGFDRWAQDQKDRSKAAYQEKLTSSKFFELEIVFREVLDHFSVPILDDVLKAPTRAVSWFVRKLQGRSSARDEFEEKVRARKDKDRRAMAETADALRSAVQTRLIEASGDPLLETLRRKVLEGPLGQSVETKAEAVWDRLEPDFVRWKEDMRTEMIEKVQDSPNLAAFLKTSKALLQVGTGVLAAVLTGGVGPVDLVIGPVTAKFTQYVLEAFGSAYFENKRRSFVELHLSRFDAVMTESVLTPLSEAYPARPDAETLERTREALERFQVPTP